MSRFLDQIRKAKEARERAARKAKLSRKKLPGKEEEPLVPEKKPKRRPSSPAEPSDHLFPSALEKKQRGDEDERAFSQDREPDDLELYPDRLEEGAPTPSTRDTQPLDLPEDLVPGEMAEGAPKKEKPPEPPKPDLIPSEISEPRPPREKPPAPPEPDLVPGEMAKGPPPKEKPPEPPRPELVPKEMAEGPTPKVKPFRPPKPDLVPREMAEGPPPKEKLPKPPEPDLVPREMAEPKAPKEKPPTPPREELVPGEMAEGPPPKVRLPEVPKPDLVPREMAEPKIPRKKASAPPEEELVPDEMADVRPPKEPPPPPKEEELVPGEMAQGPPPKEKKSESPKPDLVPPETFEGIPPKEKPETGPDLIPPEMTGFQSFKEKETPVPKPDLMPRDITKPPEAKAPEKPLESELVPDEMAEPPAPKEETPEPPEPVLVPPEMAEGSLKRDLDDEETAFELDLGVDLVPEEDEAEKKRRKKLLADAIAAREQKLAEEREEEIFAKFEGEIIPSSPEVEETAEFPAPPVEDEADEKPLVPEEPEEETVAAKGEPEEREEEPEEPEVELVFPDEEPEEPEVGLVFPDEEPPEDLAEEVEEEETPPREEFDERDFIERFEEEERLAEAREKPFVANLTGSRLTEEAEKDIIKEREELFPKELVSQKKTREPYYPEMASSGGRMTMEKAEVFPSDEIESGVTAPKPRRRRRRAYGTITAPGPEADPEFVKRVMKIAPRPDKRVMSFYDPQNHVCEEYRLLGKNLIHTFATTPGNKNLGKVITLTSSARGEGKTLTCVNLSMTLAQDLNDRVLLLDTDLRHPKVHRYMGIPSGSGLNDLLLSKDPESIFEDCLMRTDTGLHLLMASSLGRNPSPLLDSENITYYFQGELFNLVRPLAQAARLMVKNDQVEKALELLAGLKLSFSGLNRSEDKEV